MACNHYKYQLIISRYFWNNLNLPIFNHLITTLY
nr:MAG TPA: hypothetical protein [Caudoviricetes sp.]